MYQKKIVLEFTARMEAEFILSLRQQEDPSEIDLPSTTSNKQQKRVTRQLTASSTNLSTVNTKRNISLEFSDSIHQFDDPNHVAIPVHLEAAQAQLILVRLLDVIQRQIKSGELETPDDWQAQVTQSAPFPPSPSNKITLVLENHSR